MSKPLFDKKRQLQYIKSKLRLIIYLVDQLDQNSEDISPNDFEKIESELKEVIKKTKIFHFRNE